MLQEQAKLFGRLHMLLEFFLVSLAFHLSIELQHSMAVVNFIHQFTGIEIFSQVYAYDVYIFYVFTGALYWVLALRSYGGYQSARQTTYLKLAWLVLKSVSAATILFGTILFIVDPTLLNRGFLLLVFAVSLALLLLERFLMLYCLHTIRKKGHNYRQFLIVGSGERARRFAGLLEDHSEWGLRLIGFVDEPELVGQEIDGKRVIGSFDDFGNILDNNVIDEVVFCMPRKWMDRLEEYIMICERVGVKAHLALDFFNTAIARQKLSEFGGIPLLCLESTPSHPGGLFIKRGMDIIISALMLLISSPLFLLIPLLTKLTSPGPIFFGQERCGLNGRKFTMWKFRTMVKGADELKAELADLNESSGPVFKIKDDPRFTPAGKLLRKFSLDELPQFINVLKGDMSIVGPRPPIPSEVTEYDRWQRRRLSMRPGITCLWQVTGRNKIRFEEWVKLDLEYIDQWCLGLDMKIILKTIPAVLKGTGA